MQLLQRDDWTVEIDGAELMRITLFLSKCGWTFSFPAHWLLANELHVTEDDALGLANAGKIVLEEAMKDPMSAYSTINFDMAKFAELVEFASLGEFMVRSSE